MKKAQLHVGGEGTYLDKKEKDQTPVGDGGPAYPQGVVISQGGEVITTGNLLPAGFQGLSLRDHFASHAVTGVVSADPTMSTAEAAVEAFKIADEMLKVRKG